MNALDKPEDQPDPSVAASIDLICDEFEANWRSGKRPRLEDYLARAPGGSEDRLLAELLEIELELRQEGGESLRLDELHTRFPARSHLVGSIFRRVVRLRRLGDYQLLEQQGRGGMGEVYRARHTLLHQTVAIKVLPERYLDDPQLVARFRREMQMIGQLDHPNIVRAYNAGECEGTYYLVMEFLDGATLQDVVARQGPLSIGVACEAIRQAALGLQCAHERGMVHRDLKPSNLMLVRSGTVKVLDLGLARAGEGQYSQELTQSGMIVGTGDYMAPEQWEDSSHVDIRADIYSLGCTLFYLLTGKPPYADVSGGSQRERLLAHALAPIPSVRDYRTDCPEDLDKIVGHMMGKSPGDRFDTPAELADAVALFASAEELRRVAGKLDPAGGAEAPPKSPPRGAAPETTKTDLEPSRRQWTPGGSRAKRARWYRRPGPLIAVLVGLLLVGLALGGWLALRPNGRTTPPDPVAELLLLPGLNGQWWFDDMPWYLPAIRERLARGGAGGELPDIPTGRQAPYLNPNVLQVQQWMAGRVKQEIPQLPASEGELVRRLLDLSAEQVDEKTLEARLRGCLADFEAGNPGENGPASRLYTRAILEHKLAELTNDRDLAARAAESYDAAAAAYQREDGDASRLRRLCLSDAARLHSLVLGDYDEAAKRFQAAIEGETSVLFLVESLAAYGHAAAVAGQYRDEPTFARALAVLKRSDLATQSHPLVAHVHERYAWSLIDQWKVEEAHEQFQLAESIRRINLDNGKNPYASVYVYHNRHGVAMTKRYRGDAQSARQAYSELLGDVTKELARAKTEKPRPGQQRYLRDLNERLSNGHERRADCELYEGAASEPDSVDLKTAGEHYASARDAAEKDSAAFIARASKRCIVLALQGDVKAARDAFAGKTATGEVIGVDAERVRLLRQLTVAVLTLKEKDPGTGQDALRRFLDQFDLSPNYTDRQRRETQEMQLFAAELLVASGLARTPASGAPASAAPLPSPSDTGRLDTLLRGFRGRTQVLPYLWRYYDLAIRAVGSSDPNRAAGYILASRTRKSQERLPSADRTLLLFHLGRREGLAVICRPSAASAAFVLPFGRQAVKNFTHGTGRPGDLKLPEALLRALAQEQAAGRTIERHWCDAACWCDPALALTVQDWPFGEQLGLAARVVDAE